MGPTVDPGGGGCARVLGQHPKQLRVVMPQPSAPVAKVHAGGLDLFDALLAGMRRAVQTFDPPK